MFFQETLDASSYFYIKYSKIVYCTTTDLITHEFLLSYFSLQRLYRSQSELFYIALVICFLLQFKKKNKAVLISLIKVQAYS